MGKVKEDQEKELDALRQELDALRAKRLRQAQRRHRQRRSFEQSLESLSSAFQEALSRAAKKRESEESALGRALARLRTSAEAVKATLRESCDWTDAKHSWYSSIVAEAAAQRERSSTEATERQVASRQNDAEFVDIAGRLSGVKDSTQAVLSCIGPGAGKSRDTDVMEQYREQLRRAGSSFVAFRALPTSVKLRTLAEDPAVLCLSIFALLLGAALALAIYTEGFGTMRCRLLCAAQLTSSPAPPLAGRLSERVSKGVNWLAPSYY